MSFNNRTAISFVARNLEKGIHAIRKIASGEVELLDVVQTIAYDSHRYFQKAHNLGDIRIRDSSGESRLIDLLPKNWPPSDWQLTIGRAKGRQPKGTSCREHTPGSLLALLEQSEGWDTVYLLAPLLWGPPTGGFNVKSLKKQYDRYRTGVLAYVAFQKTRLYEMVAALSGAKNVPLCWLQELHKLVEIDGQEEADYSLLCAFIGDFKKAGYPYKLASLMSTMAGSKNPQIRMAAMARKSAKAVAEERLKEKLSKANAEANQHKQNLEAHEIAAAALEEQLVEAQKAAQAAEAKLQEVVMQHQREQAKAASIARAAVEDRHRQELAKAGAKIMQHMEDAEAARTAASVLEIQLEDAKKESGMLQARLEALQCQQRQEQAKAVEQQLLEQRSSPLEPLLGSPADAAAVLQQLQCHPDLRAVLDAARLRRGEGVSR